jgi:hypothetical protein
MYILSRHYGAAFTSGNAIRFCPLAIRPTADLGAWEPRTGRRLAIDECRNPITEPISSQSGDLFAIRGQRGHQRGGPQFAADGLAAKKDSEDDDLRKLLVDFKGR